MTLKLVVKLITLMMFCTSSMFAFELSSNHYGAFGKLLKGKQTYSPSLVFPFSEAFEIDSNFKTVFYTEKLPPILTENHSKFYLYARNFNSEFLELSVNGIRINDSNITVTTFSKYQDQINLVELNVDNTVINADEVAKIEVQSYSDNPIWIYKETISNHFNIFPTQIISRKEDGFYRKYAVISQCSEDISNISIELRNQTLDFNFKQGYQIQMFELPLIDKTSIFKAKVFVGGLLYGTEEIKTQPWVENSIHLIPILSANRVKDYSADYPIELSEIEQIDFTNFDRESFSRQVNYSIDITNGTYPNKIGFLQEKDVLKYSSILYDKPYPSRMMLSRLMDLNIKTLGYFQRETYGYPESYNHSKNVAYIYDDGSSRELLVYKQYNSVKLKSDEDLEKRLIHHEYKLTQNKFPFKQSIVFVEIEDQDDLKRVGSFIDRWSKTYQSPALSIENFNQFGKLFLNRNRTRLDHKVQVESPYRLQYKNTPVFRVENNWISMLSDMENKVVRNSQFSVFNPGSNVYSGIISFQHTSNSLSHAKWKDGTSVKLQKYKANHYFALVSDLNPFEVKTLIVSEGSINSKSKPQFSSINRKSGLINWKYKGNRISKKKEDLFVPIFKDGLNTDEIKTIEGYLKNKGSLFSEYIRHITTVGGTQIEINSYVFNDLPLVKYKYKVKTESVNHSTHISFNLPLTPSQYSIDRLYKEEYGYSKFGNHNVLESDQSIFLLDKTKLLLSSPNHLRWEYNSTTFNTNETGFIERSTYPNQMYLLVSGSIEPHIYNTPEKEVVYEFDVVLGDENAEMVYEKQLPICMDEIKLKKLEIELFKLDNTNIKVVNIHPTDKESQFVIELKNTSHVSESTTFTPRRNKSTVYNSLFTGKKIGIIKGKLKFEPQELKTIRISL